MRPSGCSAIAWASSMSAKTSVVLNPPTPKAGSKSPSAAMTFVRDEMEKARRQAAKVSDRRRQVLKGPVPANELDIAVIRIRKLRNSQEILRKKMSAEGQHS